MSFDKLKDQIRPLYDIVGSQLPQFKLSSDVLTHSALDWKVGMRQMVMAGFEMHTIPNYKATVRTDTGAYLGVVGNTYKVRQNEETFAMFDGLVQSRKLKWKYAGSLRGDRIVFVCANGNTHIQLSSKWGRIDSYLMLTNAHDGRNAMTMVQYFIHRETDCVIQMPLNLIDRVQFRNHSGNQKKAEAFMDRWSDNVSHMHDLLTKASDHRLELAEIDWYLKYVMPRQNVKFVTAGDKMRSQILLNYNTINGTNLMDLLMCSAFWVTHQRKYAGDSERVDSLLYQGRAYRTSRRYSDAAFKLLTID